MPRRRASRSIAPGALSSALGRAASAPRRSRPRPDAARGLFIGGHPRQGRPRRGRAGEDTDVAPSAQLVERSIERRSTPAAFVRLAAGSLPLQWTAGEPAAEHGAAWVLVSPPRASSMPAVGWTPGDAVIQRDALVFFIWPQPVATARSAIVASLGHRSGAHHGRVAVRAREVDRASVASAPIRLTSTRIELAAPAPTAFSQALDIGHEQVVADELDLVADRVGERASRCFSSSLVDASSSIERIG